MTRVVAMYEKLATRNRWDVIGRCLDCDLRGVVQPWEKR